MRLDQYLHKHNYTTSRNRANYLIINKKVQVGDKIITKPSYKIQDEKVTILEDTIYVSRAAYKLKSFLQTHNIDVMGKDVLDIGSSTGGFIQVLCENDAKSVVGVDVGTDQLHQSVKSDLRVTSYEKTDIRDFKSQKRFEFITCDVSFVGISYIIEEIDRLGSDKIVILFKPQFEVGKDVKRDKRGVVKNDDAILKATDKFEKLTKKLGWKQLVKSASDIKGKEGNEEIFYYFTKR